MKKLRVRSRCISIRKELKRHRRVWCAKLDANWFPMSMVRYLYRRVERRTCCVGNTLNTLSSNANDVQWRWLRSCCCSRQWCGSGPKRGLFTNQIYDEQNSEQGQDHDIAQKFRKKWTKICKCPSVQRCKQSREQNRPQAQSLRTQSTKVKVGFISAKARASRGHPWR